MRREANARGEGACRHSASLSQWIDKVHERIFFFGRALDMMCMFVVQEQQ